MSKQLLFIPSPRNLNRFTEATGHLEIDKLWMKFYPQEEAYTKAREWFLKHDQYTHLIILPDDLLVKQHALDLLIEDSEAYDIVSGWCPNTVRDNGETDSNISVMHLPPDPPSTNLYHELHFESLIFLDHMVKVGMQLISVKHQGFALTVLPRYIVQKIPFRTSAGCCVDSCLSLDLHSHEIPQFVDLRARSLHIKTNPDILRVGVEKQGMVFESC